LVVKVPAPELFSDAAPSTIEPLLNVTVPVGVPPEVAVTVAVRVTLAPTATWAADNARVVVVVALKVAVAALAAVILTAHVPTPEQTPLHPPKVKPAAGVAVRLTKAPLLKFALQVLGQVIPAGALVTAPVPTRLTVNGKVVGMVLKVAVTD
jgi:hypothetical protein